MKETIRRYFAEKNYQKIISCRIQDETDNEILELTGLSALQLAHFQLAEKIFKQLINVVNSASHHYHLGLSMMNQNKFNQAIHYFDESLIDNKFLIAAKINTAHCLFKIKKANEAIQILSEVLQNNGEVKQAHYMLLNHYRKMKQIEALRKQLHVSKAYIEKDYEWFKNHCYYLFYCDDYKELIKLISENNFKNRIEILNILANSYNKLKEYRKSIDVFRTIINLDSTKESHWLNLASAYSQLTSDKDLSQSLMCTEKCILINDKSHQAYYCRSIVYEKLTDYDSAIKEIENAIKIKKESKYQYKLAELLNHTNNNQLSLNILDEILKQDKRNVLANRLKGIIELQLGQAQKSEQSLLNTIKIDKTDQRAIAYYAISKIAQHKVSEVQEFLSLNVLVKKFKLDPTPAYENLNAFNKDLERDIKNHSLLRKEPNGLAARNGYLTDDLFSDQTNSIKLFKQLLEEKIKEYITSLPDDSLHHMLRHKTFDYEINSWATLIKGDGFIDKHIHEESWISGAYYCKTPTIIEQTDSHQGYFEYGCIPDDIDYHIAKERGYVKPEEGMLVIFPSYLYHRTIPHVSEEDRISIAFDLTPKSWLK